MQKKQTILICLLLIMGFYSLLTYSCKKDDSNTADETTVKDIDGNVYKTVTIGNQTWMAENLRTTRYNDSTLIPLPFAKSSAIFGPFVCTYKYSTNSDTIKTYGRLYNWYALTANNGKLCPKGWHIPSDAEWTTLTNYLTAHGYNYDGSATANSAAGTTPENRVGKALASSSGWLSSAIEGSVGNTDFPDKRNATGFTAFPGGVRAENGQFTQMGMAGYWWTFTESTANTTNAIGRSLINNYSNISSGTASKTCGFSVRCVKGDPVN